MALSRFLKYPPRPSKLTHEERIAEAAALSSFALDIFTSAADDLEESASALEQVSIDIEADIELLVEAQASADYEAERARNAAYRIRDLFESA